VVALGWVLYFFDVALNQEKHLMTVTQSFLSNSSSDATQLPAFLLTPDAANPEKEPLKHLLIGSPQAVRSTIHVLHARGYAEVGVWSPLLPTAKSGEVMSIFVKYLRI
jgi:hypothetical protein